MAIKTITVQGDPPKFEATAAAAITPGHLLELTSAGKVKVHATADGTCEKAFAIESDLEGEDIDDAYATGDLVSYRIFRPGDVVWAKVANGEDIAIGDKLVSNGNGELKELTQASAGVDEFCNCLVGYALDACDMSGSSGVDPSGRCRVRVA